MVMAADEAARRGLKPLARIVATATAGIDPAIMGMGKSSCHRQHPSGQLDFEGSTIIFETKIVPVVFPLLFIKAPDRSEYLK